LKKVNKDKKDTIAVSKFFTWSLVLLTIIFIPLLFVSNDLIASSKFLVDFSNIFSGVFPTIEKHGIISGYYGLYDKAKLSLTLGVFVTLITFVVFFYIMSKTFLCSFGFIKKSNENYMSAGLVESKQNFKEILGLFFASLLFSYILYGYYFGSLNTEYDGSFSDARIYGTSLMIVLRGILGWGVSVMLVMTIFAVLCHIYKKFKSDNDIGLK